MMLDDSFRTGRLTDQYYCILRLNTGCTGNTKAICRFTIFYTWIVAMENQSTLPFTYFVFFVLFLLTYNNNLSSCRSS